MFGLVISKMAQTHIINPYTAVLGEGIIATPDGPAWVDIEARKVIWAERVYDLPKHIPSVIFEAHATHLMLGTHLGICHLLRDGRVEMLFALSDFDSADFRLNDGCKLSDGSFLVGSMSRTSIDDRPGHIYRFTRGGQNFRYDWPCHIPNSFIELDDGRVLVSDSHRQTIYALSPGDEDLAVAPWYHAAGAATPDGGCRLPNGQICLAMWDGFALCLFDQAGQLIDEIALPVARPTNCFYDAADGGFYVTSARQGLDAQALQAQPQSGACFFVPWSAGGASPVRMD